MLDDHYATQTSVWIVILPMLISVYIASLLVVAVLVNLIDNVLFEHKISEIRTLFIYGSIFVGFLVASFSISISTYIAIPLYKKLFMAIVFFIPILWPRIISLFLMGVENYDFVFDGVNTELVVFISGSIIGGFTAYTLANKFKSDIV
jgi:hypothetical protein